MNWDWLANMPLRKLLAVIVTVVWILVVVVMLKLDHDIPGNIYNLLLAMCGAVYGGYFGTSTIEHCKRLDTEKQRLQDIDDEETH